MITKIFVQKIHFEANFERFTKFLNHENLELYGTNIRSHKQILLYSWVTVTHPAVHYFRNNVHKKCATYRLLPSTDYGCLHIFKTVLIKWGLLLSISMVKHTHIHIPQMPISAQQWRLAVGRVNASQSLQSRVTGQPKMKLTSLHILLCILTALLGAVLYGDGGKRTGERSE